MNSGHLIQFQKYKTDSRKIIKSLVKYPKFAIKILQNKKTKDLICRLEFHISIKDKDKA